MRQWYVAVTRAAAEWQAQREILNKGLHCYYPYVYADVRRGRWSQGAIKPQFPGYVFVGVDSGASLEPVRSVAGINHLIRLGGGTLLTTSDAQMLRCKRECHQRHMASVPRIWKAERGLEPGDWIMVPYGDGAGLPAEVLSIDKHGQISASLGNLRISCHADDLRRGVRASAKPSRSSAPEPESRLRMT